MRQTLDQILMYRRFADTELRGSSTDGGFILDNVHSQITGSLFDVIPHVPDLLRCVSETVYALRRRERSKIKKALSFKKIQRKLKIPHRKRKFPRFLCGICLC